MSNATIAKLLLVALSFCWGLSWTAMRIALDEVSPWGMRLIGYGIGAATLLILLKAQGRSLAIPPGRNWLHIFIASLFLSVSFGVAGTFAQLMANTSRVIIVNYSMPVWGSLMAYFVLRERINAPAALGLALCVAGLGVLVYPVAETSLREPIGLLLALVCALGWGGGTVYMKWARIKGDLLAISFWQVMVGAVAFAIFYLVFQGVPKFEPLQWRTWAGLLFDPCLPPSWARAKMRRPYRGAILEIEIERQAGDDLVQVAVSYTQLTQLFHVLEKLAIDIVLIFDFTHLRLSLISP